jgi:hypothetical protein
MEAFASLTNKETTLPIGYNSKRCGSSSAVERLLAKEKVEGSSPFFRSIKQYTPVLGVLRRRGQEVKAGVCKTPIRRFESARRLLFADII